MARIEADEGREQAAERSLDRHALVMAVWLPLGFVALLLFLFGYRQENGWIVAGAFGLVFAGFVGHVIVNAVYTSLFSARELALGLVVYVLGLLAFLLALLFGSGRAEALFLPIGLGFFFLAAAVLFYLVTQQGLRRTFEAFDVIRDFRPRSPTPPGGR